MSKMGNYVVELQESDDFRFGWESAERGEPSPDWPTNGLDDLKRLATQQYGWAAYRAEQVSP
jgi:hypothetical protein